jgi:type IX secretion system PorP/SprF family membrane protein
MKKYFLLLFTCVLIGQLQSQQLPNYTLFMMNPFIYNPALAGTANYWQIRSNHRFQWLGFEDAPITNSISAYGPHKKKNMGYGGSIYNDVTGPISRTGGYGAYGYNVAVSSTGMRLSMGLTLGFMQYKIDGTKVKMQETDVALPEAVVSRVIPDASVGIYAYSTNYYFGFAANQLLNNAVTKKTEIPTGTIGANKLKSHFYLMGGYIFEINREWDIEPGMVLSKMVPAPFQLELYCKGIFNNILWGGLSFRTQDAVSLAFGYTYEKKIFVGYTVDISVNELRKYTYGSHEIFIGFNFDKIRKTGSKKK